MFYYFNGSDSTSRATASFVGDVQHAGYFRRLDSDLATSIRNINTKFWNLNYQKKTMISKKDIRFSIKEGSPLINTLLVDEIVVKDIILTGIDRVDIDMPLILIFRSDTLADVQSKIHTILDVFLNRTVY